MCGAAVMRTLELSLSPRQVVFKRLICSKRMHAGTMLHSWDFGSRCIYTLRHLVMVFGVALLSHMTESRQKWENWGDHFVYHLLVSNSAVSVLGLFQVFLTIGLKYVFPLSYTIFWFFSNQSIQLTCGEETTATLLGWENLLYYRSCGSYFTSEKN